MKRLGRWLRTRKALLYALVVALFLPYFLTVIFEAPSSAQFLAVSSLALGLSALIRAYGAGDDR